MAKSTNTGETYSSAATPMVGSPAPLFELARLLARHAAQLDFTQRETKDEVSHDQTD